jgi:hypothetical protein
MFGIDDAIAAGLKLADTAIERLLPDPQKAAELRAATEAALRTSLMQWDAQQNEVNKIEAASSSTFVAGWRPYIGWVAGTGLAYQYLFRPIAQWLALWIDTGHPGTMPSLDQSLYELVVAMLGMAGIKTYERVQSWQAGKKNAV